MSVENAILNFSKKQIKKKKRRNKKPDKDKTEKPVMAWLKSKGFSCHGAESKAVYNPKAGRYISSQIIPGCSDIIGCDPKGRAVFIELKAPGKLNDINKNPRQKAFLQDKIYHGAFACVVDSAERLENIYISWLTKNETEKKTYLLSHLP